MGRGGVIRGRLTSPLLQRKLRGVVVFGWSMLLSELLLISGLNLFLARGLRERLNLCIFVFKCTAKTFHFAYSEAIAEAAAWLLTICIL